MEGNAMQELEKKLNYTFRDPALLSEALSHSSYANEHRAAGLRGSGPASGPPLCVRRAWTRGRGSWTWAAT